MNTCASIHTDTKWEEKKVSFKRRYEGRERRYPTNMVCRFCTRGPEIEKKREPNLRDLI